MSTLFRVDMHIAPMHGHAEQRGHATPPSRPRVDPDFALWHDGSAMALKLVIFDLDGTLLEPAFDFEAIRREIGLAPGASILEAMDTLSEAERARAGAILDRHEAEAADRSRLMPGAGELLDWLRRQGIRTAVLTRNSRRSVENACQKHGLEFSGVVARGDHLPKPSPVGVRHLMSTLGTEPEETIVVGDFRFDVEAGAAAGCRTIALVADPAPGWASGATWTAADLAEVRRILSEAHRAT